MYTINVVNKRKHKSTPHDFYLGRPNVLGNRYTHKPSGTIAEVVVGSREEAIKRYADDFPKRLAEKDFRQEFMRIFDYIVENKQANLICWCSPQPCHCDIIKAHLEIFLRETS